MDNYTVIDKVGHINKGVIVCCPQVFSEFEQSTFTLYNGSSYIMYCLYCGKKYNSSPMHINIFLMQHQMKRYNKQFNQLNSLNAYLLRWSPLDCWHTAQSPAATPGGSGTSPHRWCHRWGWVHWHYGSNSVWWSEISPGLLCPRSGAEQIRKSII